MTEKASQKIELDCRVTNFDLWKEWVELRGDDPNDYPSGWVASEAYILQDIERFRKNLTTSNKSARLTKQSKQRK